MNPSLDKFRTLRLLTEKSLDGSLTQEEASQLEALIRQDPQQRQYYCQYTHMTIGLMRSCTDRVPATGEQQLDNLMFSSLWKALSREEKTAPSLDIPNLEIPAPTSSTQKAKPSKKVAPSKPSFTLQALAAICLLGLTLVLVIGLLHQKLAPQEVATLKNRLNASFRKGGGPNVGMRLTNRKTPWTLEQGLMEIQFDNGANVVIEGPATFRCLQDNQIKLQQGQLFATVPPEARGFSVITPGSQVIDMGTEFGISVATNGTSDLHMIKGKAALNATHQSQHQPNHVLTSGQAKRVEPSGHIQDIPIQQQQFARRFNPKTAFIWRGQKLSMADLVGLGNGLGSGRSNVFLDPVEGYQDRLYSSAQGNHFHPVAENPFIDGIFVPNGSTPQVVSSEGHQFGDCPITNGECYAGVSANPNRGLYIYDYVNNLTVRVIDPSAQGTDSFVLADEIYTVTGDEPGADLLPESRRENRLGTGTWVHFKLGTPVPLQAQKQYGFDVTVTYGNSGYCFETAGTVKDIYSGGTAYSSGTTPGTHSLRMDRIYQGDHTFIAELAPNIPVGPAQQRLVISYQRQQPELGPDDVYCLQESTIDRENVEGFTQQTYSADNDHATYIAQDRSGLGQTFTTGSDPKGYLMTGFWLKNVDYQRNLPEGNGSWWYVGAQRRNGLIRFNDQLYGTLSNPCLVMHANLGVTFDLQALQSQCPGIIAQRFVCQTGVADLAEAEPCHMDFWILVDGQVRASHHDVTTKGQLHDLAVDLMPGDRFLTLITTDGGDPDRPGTFQRAYTCDWGVFAEPMLVFDSM